MAQSEKGRIRLMQDFTTGYPVAGTDAGAVPFGNFNIVGQGIAETDSGIPVLDTGGLNGIGRFTTTDEDIHAIGVQTGKIFNAAKMGTFVAECRVKFPVITTGEFFFGFSDVQTDLAIIEGALFHGATATITLSASDGAGFLISSELTNSALIYAVYNGGATTGVTVAATNSLGVSIVADKFNILRLEVDLDGTTRWYVDERLLKTVVGAVSTTTDLCLSALVESKTTAVKTADVDYVWVTANRDWTV